MLVGAVGVLGPGQQVDGAPVPQHKLHEGPGDGHVRGAKVEGDVVWRGGLAHERPEHERKERVRLLPVHIFGPGDDVGGRQHPRGDVLPPEALQQPDDLQVGLQGEVLAAGVEQVAPGHG